MKKLWTNKSAPMDPPSLTDQTGGDPVVTILSASPPNYPSSLLNFSTSYLSPSPINTPSHSPSSTSTTSSPSHSHSTLPPFLAAPPTSPATTLSAKLAEVATIPLSPQQATSTGEIVHLCLYCTEKVDIQSESYCQLGSGTRYWHTRCVESSRARKETTMMLMHSMNQLTTNFFGRLSTGINTLRAADMAANPSAVDPDPDLDERSTSNTSDLDTDCCSSATEGDYTIRPSTRPRKSGLNIAVWDDSDVSDADFTLRGKDACGSIRNSGGGGNGGGGSSGSGGSGGGGAGSSPKTRRRPPVVVTNSAYQGSPMGTVRRGVVGPWPGSLRPHGTFYRSLSFELDSAGNTIRPKAKRQKGKEPKKKDKGGRKHRAAKGGVVDDALIGGGGGAGGLGCDAVDSADYNHHGSSNNNSSSALDGPPHHQAKRGSHQRHTSSSSLSSLSSDDDMPPVTSSADKDNRPRKKKRPKGGLSESNNIKGAGFGNNHRGGAATSRCAICSEVIGKDANYIFVNGSKHHIDCFTCSSCMRPRLYEMGGGKTVCLECLPVCDGCSLPLIPSPVKHGKPRSLTGSTSSGQPANSSSNNNNNHNHHHHLLHHNNNNTSTSSSSIASIGSGNVGLLHSSTNGQHNSGTSPSISSGSYATTHNKENINTNSPLGNMHNSGGSEDLRDKLQSPSATSSGSGGGSSGSGGPSGGGGSGGVDDSNHNSSSGSGGGGGSGGGDKEDGEMEILVERDGVVQRYHRKCFLMCALCKQPVQRKRGKVYKKQGKPWCARCISKCSVFEDKALLVTKSAPVSKSRSASIQGTNMSPSFPNTIEELMSEEPGLHSFIDFMVNDHSVEHVLFFLDVEAFKRLKRKQDILIQANNIYNKYLITDAELEVALIDAEERKKLTYILANKTGKVKNNFFEAPQKHVYMFLKENAFPRYLKSEEHKTLLRVNGVAPQLASPSTGSAS